MSETNERWARDQWQAKKGGAYLAVLAAPLWLISYQLSGPIYTMPQWPWFAASSIATLLAAIRLHNRSGLLCGFRPHQR